MSQLDFKSRMKEAHKATKSQELEIKESQSSSRARAAGAAAVAAVAFANPTHIDFANPALESE
eukprot:COSAG06_NODE_51378_length_312_cov_1.220657_1_plen_62_part_10